MTYKITRDETDTASGDRIVEHGSRWITLIDGDDTAEGGIALIGTTHATWETINGAIVVRDDEGEITLAYRDGVAITWIDCQHMIRIEGALRGRTSAHRDELCGLLACVSDASIDDFDVEINSYGDIVLREKRTDEEKAESLEKIKEVDDADR